MTASLRDETTRTRAIDYIWEQLGQGKTLAALVLRTVNFSQGTITSLVPDSYGPLEISEFDRGHVTDQAGRRTIKVGTISGSAVPKANVRKELAELICPLLDSEGLCLL